MPSLHICLLSHFQLHINHSIVLLPSRLQSLMAYLALHQNVPLSRQQLAFAFWPDSSEGQARANLRKSLSDLRRAWPELEYFIHTQDQLLCWRPNTDVTLDVTSFNQYLIQAAHASDLRDVQAALEQALSLYRGDILPDCYEDWLLPERERLRQDYLNARQQLIHILVEQEAYTAAIEQAQRLLQDDPLQEAGYRTLMRLYMRQGEQARALRVYHTCATLLQQELGVSPGSETHALYEYLLHSDRTVALPIPQITRARKLPLVGRQTEWTTLLAAWQQAAAGDAHCVLVTGEAGIGKSHLALALRQWAEGRGHATAATRTYAVEGQLAYAPVVEWLRSPAIHTTLLQLSPVWLTELARLLPELQSTRPELAPLPLTDSWQRQRFREALAQALLAGERPLLLVFDDLQWCDPETLEWLRYFLRFASQAWLLVVGTLRPEEVGEEHPLAALRLDLHSTSQVSEISLGPLNATETAALAAQVTGKELDPAQAAHLYAQSEGYPLFVVEMARADDVSLSVSADASLPLKVQAVIQARLAQLSPGARRLASLAATVGRAFTLSVLIHASVDDEDGLVRDLDELWQRRIIREQGEQAYDFSHDKIREVAYAGTSPMQRRLLHKRVAQALESIHASDLDGVSGQIAAHYEQAGLPAQAAPYYQQAAEAAQRIYASQEAVYSLTRALEILQTLPQTLANRRQELDMQIALGMSLEAWKGYSASGIEDVYRRAEQLCQQVGTPRHLYSVLNGLYSVYVTRAQLQMARQLAEQLLTPAQALAEPLLLYHAQTLLGIVLAHLGEWKSSRLHLDQDQAFLASQTHPVASSPTLHDPRLFGQNPQLLNYRHTAIVLWHLGYPAQALEKTNQTMALAQALDHPYSLAGVLIWSALLHTWRREPQIVQARAKTAIALAEKYEFAFWLRQGRVLMGWALTEQGHAEQGIACMQEALVHGEAMNAYVHRPLFLTLLAEAYSKADQPEHALRVLTDHGAGEGRNHG
jgi:DNA-binding SARP family transcriptional activator